MSTSENEITLTEEEQIRAAWQATKAKFLIAGGVGVPALIADVASHAGPGGLFFGAIATFIAVRHGDDIVAVVNKTFPPASRTAARRALGHVFSRGSKTQPVEDAQPLAQAALIQNQGAEEDRQEPSDTIEQPQAAYPTNPGIKVAPQAIAALPSQQILAQQSTQPGTAAEKDEESMVDWNATASTPPPSSRTKRRSGDIFRLRELVDAGFVPTPDKIFIGRVDGQNVFVRAAQLCHVAIAGRTGAGKGSIMRMLAAQLCYIGADVLYLTPHYMPKVIAEAGPAFDEDWTPFARTSPRTGKPYLYRPADVCADVAEMAHQIDWAVNTLLEGRIIAARQQAQRFKPFFVFIDEWPAFLGKSKRIAPDAPEQLGYLLREGRKYGVFVVLASQDFAVKTIGIETGSLRDCFWTVFYPGGDPITVKQLLKEGSKTFDENQLGQGIVGLRYIGHEAALSEQPFADNEAIYAWLGESLYKGPDPRAIGQTVVQEEQVQAPVATKKVQAGSLLNDLYQRWQAGEITEEQFLDIITGKAAQFDAEADDEEDLTGVVAPRLPDADLIAPPQRSGISRKISTGDLPKHLRLTYHVYQKGLSHHQIANIISAKSHVTAGNHIRQLKDMGFIDNDGNKMV